MESKEMGEVCGQHFGYLEERNDEKSFKKRSYDV